MKTGIVAMIIGSAIVVAGIVVWLVFCAKRRKQVVATIQSFEEKNVDGELSFSDIIAWFKSLGLDQKQDVPFIVKGSMASESIAKYFKTQNMENIPQPGQKVEGKVSVFCGVYNEKTEKLMHGVFIYADTLDAETLKVLGDRELVVLS